MSIIRHAAWSLAIVAGFVAILPGPWERDRLVLIAGAVTSMFCLFTLMMMLRWRARLRVTPSQEGNPMPSSDDEPLTTRQHLARIDSLLYPRRTDLAMTSMIAIMISSGACWLLGADSGDAMFWIMIVGVGLNVLGLASLYLAHPFLANTPGDWKQGLDQS